MNVVKKEENKSNENKSYGTKEVADPDAQIIGRRRTRGRNGLNLGHRWGDNSLHIKMCIRDRP